MRGAHPHLPNNATYLYEMQKIFLTKILTHITIYETKKKKS